MFKFKTLRGKIILGVLFISIVVVSLINITVWRVFQDNFKKSIINDMMAIKHITRLEISRNYNLESTMSSNKGKVLSILNDINNQYDIYISIDNNSEQNIAFTGVLLDERDKINILIESNEKQSLLYLNSEGGKFYVSYSYPMYDEGKYIGTLVLQKSYLELYNDYKLLLLKIILIQCILFLLMILIINIWLKKTTVSLKILAKGISDVGDGDFTNRLEVKGKDEVAILVHHFNSMQERILSQIQHLKKEKKRVEELEKSTKKFFNCATHEMRTPLTAISGYTQLLQQNTLNEQQVQRSYKRLSIEGKRLSNMVENMLVLAKGKEKIIHEPEYFDVKNLLIDVIEGFEFISEKRKINFKVNERSAMVFAAEEDIRKVFINLIDNGVKYSKDDKINVKCEYNDKAIITIENKCGEIPSNIKDNLFEPFTKYNYGDNTQVSSGLGLVICRELVNKNNGKINYEFHEGNISFKVELYR
ncbi:HAMP domain-containing sensor histidine kinase [Oceanirhabdus sp. W0125-5]|uniref:HAMP domain-containing sensor histidine kinase n=1 Tax=Oceanirhabdus sp. W0125-5 TaxID=2999116 RepID=UPI0022F2FA59|nr:HAMP domain-containing sensor histidine kinase [Oceanirhabdus sp. W0125-5]WBW99024.1 HAMP domain-containing sensor histidine kinase [Oceanirhabdus sp. W0125-5]